MGRAQRSVAAHLPNAITLLRLALIPVLGWAVLAERNLAAAAVIVASAGSDVVDGFLARRWRVESRFGALLDPVADKLTQLTGLVLLALTRAPAFTPVPALLVAVVLARDLLLAYGAARLGAHRGSVRIRPRLEGKASTALVFLILLAACLAAPRALVLALAWAAGALAVLAGARYTLDGWRQEATARARSGR